MTLEEDLKQEVQTIIMEIMMVLHKHGIKEVHMGAILRLMGVEEEKAQLEDNERIYLDEKFTKYIERMLELANTKTNEQTLH